MSVSMKTENNTSTGMRAGQNLIGGKWVDSVSGKTFATTNPSPDSRRCISF